MTVRVGFIGAGAVARRHAQTLLGFGDVEVTGVTDVSPVEADALAALSGARTYTDAEALLSTSPDAVYICVPPFAHGGPDRLALEAGAAVFFEKPLARDLRTAEAIAALAAERGALTATGYHWRYLEAVERARELLESRSPRLAIASWLDKVPPPAWWIKRALSGGQVVEQATHVLDVMLDLVGDVEEVHAVASFAPRPSVPEADVDDVTAGLLRFASGAVGCLTASSLPSAKVRAGVELLADGLRIEIAEAPEDGGQARVRVDRDFIDAVAGMPNRIRVPYDVALRTHRVACALVRAADTREPAAP